MPARWGEQGQILGPRFYDGKLVSLAAAENNGKCTLRLEVCKLSGNLVQLELHDITDFSIAQFWKGAIISEA